MPDETHPAEKALTSFAAKMRDMADAMEKADQMIYERLILGIPSEPPQWTAVRVESGSRVAFRMGVLSSGRNWQVEGYGEEWRTWPEVCALGTPEVLEPETVKALRERVEFLANQRDRFRTAHDEMVEKYHAVCGERNEARATLDQIRAEFRKAFTVDLGGWDWRDDDAIQTLARALSRLLSAKPATEDETP
jgi:hypothetical protein